MNYTIIILRSALKELQDLPLKVRRRIDERLQRLTENPRPDGCKKLKGSDDLYRIAIGTYRVIYRIEDGRLVITIIRVRHRKDAY